MSATLLEAIAALNAAEAKQVAVGGPRKDRLIDCEVAAARRRVASEWAAQPGWPAWLQRTASSKTVFRAAMGERFPDLEARYAEVVAREKAAAIADRVVDSCTPTGPFMGSGSRRCIKGV